MDSNEKYFLMLLVVPSVLLFIHMILYSIWYRCSEDKVTHTLMYHLSKIFAASGFVSVFVVIFFWLRSLYI